MILESNNNSLVIPEEKPQDLLLRLKTKISMTMDGNYFGGAYGDPDYEIRVAGLIKSRDLLNESQVFLEGIDSNNIYYTDHNDVKWSCHCNPDEQSLRRRSREVWVLSLRLIGTTI